jgi:peroxiredoxin Q/BCP
MPRARVVVGNKAPDFSLPSQSGGVVSLSDFIGKKNVVLYFYPKDYTTGCTKEARTFRSMYDELKKLDAEVLGVSSDSVASHQGFAESCGLPYPILSDREKRVRGLYGVSSTLGIIPGRVTFVIDKRGTVRGVFSSQLQPERHVREAIEVLKSLLT